MLSIWLASRWARTADQRADAAQQEAKKWQDAAVAAKAELAAFKSESERRRSRRRPLR